MSGPLLTDSQWLRHAFLVKGLNLETVDQENQYYSTAASAFTDTAPGGSLCVNPPPQFTRYADLKPDTKSRNTDSPGIGRYYHEAIEKNSQLLYMRFGVTQFTSMTQFFTGFYNSGAGMLARTGRASSTFYTLGRATGFLVGILNWRLLAVALIGGIAGQAVRFFLGKPSSKFCYLKPAMPLYHTAVQTIVNHICVNVGIVPRIGASSTSTTTTSTNTTTTLDLTGGYQFTSAAAKIMHARMPNVFDEGGEVNVYALMTRGQRLFQKHMKQLQNAFDTADTDVATAVGSIYKPTNTLKDSGASYTTYMNNWFAGAQSQPKASTADTSSSNINLGGTASGSSTDTSTNTNNGGSTSTATDTGFDSSLESADKTEGFWSKMGAFWDAEMEDGAAFAVFRVDATGPQQESFSNSTGESEISQKMNGMSSSARSTSFNFSGGNVTGMIGSALDAVKDFAGGVLDSLQLSGLAAVGGAAMVDIPQHWQSSIANLPHATYNVALRSPYGNEMSRLFNLYIPLAMLLAGALPLSAGKQSYVSPFCMEYYDKGRSQSRYAMIDSMSITRGVGNTGFHQDGYPLGIDVSFTIKDLSSIMHMPISEGFSFNPTEGIFDDETIFSDYMAVLASMGVADQIYAWRKFKLNLTTKLAEFNTWASIAHFTSFMGDTMPGRLMSAVHTGITR